jgi:hypothetical protein
MDGTAKQLRGAFTIGVKKSILGARVINAEREDLGRIEDLVLDVTENRVAYAILSLGGFLGFGDKHFAIPWEALSLDISEKVAVLSINKERLTNAPGFDPDSWPDMADPDWGARVTQHYKAEPQREQDLQGGAGEPPTHR